MSNKKCYYVFEDPSGTKLTFKATSLQQAYLIKKKKAHELGIPKEAFEITSISKKPSQGE
ncbi:hypothetical protein I8J29_05050 [Paenibacillus sp. MWE-103]|uniref:Uncharacterized protein n=1 Tax=Paenibacillus artemisiicola TaxID=1172618 RepID=A0ABS3W5I2_9BACL|nr:MULTISPECIES: hypothetical protein [Paenibacillus]MBO7743551.1 hypothetical protein [Paenibacillus artemisiicola]SFJ34150.1 hypothetical protein SAMN02799624_04157 [Paenibacillus sp. UNC496MF]